MPLLISLQLHQKTMTRVESKEFITFSTILRLANHISRSLTIFSHQSHHLFCERAQAILYVTFVAPNAIINMLTDL